VSNKSCVSLNFLIEISNWIFLHHTGVLPFNELDGMKWKWLQKAGESNGTIAKK
jgi:hypothetical protein